MTSIRRAPSPSYMRCAPARRRMMRARDELAASLRLMGFLASTAADWKARKHAKRGVDPGRVEALIAARKAARDKRDFAEADRIRGELTSMGVVLKDSKDGTTWEVMR